MKFFLPALLLVSSAFAQEWIRVNQLGYTPSSLKPAVFVSASTGRVPQLFTVHDALTDRTVYASSRITSFGPYGPFHSTARFDLSGFKEPGTYYIKTDTVRSPVFRISETVYDGTADFLLRYMRQQRSGYNPYLDDSCHTQDGFIIYHPSLDSTRIDVSGGWHDASDYLQYVTTSATAVYQMLTAYERRPASFADRHLSNGRPGRNGIPDILDEARWGLEWLVKMNPGPDLMFNQLADDRDHRGFRLPTEDTVYYGLGRSRPVYTVTGRPQGIYQHKNRSTGTASTAAKFSSSFALGARLLSGYDTAFASLLRRKSADAYRFGERSPGVCQTAPCGAPYFYEEDNWSDDMQLAAAELFRQTGDPRYSSEAVRYGRMEPVTPWLGADTARHYQWYPFVNLGHVRTANIAGARKEFIGYLRQGIDSVYRKGRGNAFSFGIPFIWCSNNLVSSFLTQMMLYRELSGDRTYDMMEASLRDWLFGCNIWGTSMVYGLPAWGDTPTDPHSAFTHVYGYPIDGGLIDGPVRSTIFDQHRRYIRLTKPDPYAALQSPLAVYHDDWGDYTNNEPTMDGTAGLTMVLSALESGRKAPDHRLSSHGGIVRFDTTKREVYLVFTGHEYADGGESIRRTLKKHFVKASFFFTGDFYRESRFRPLIASLRKEGHYLGAHSDRHLLYADWERRDSLLVDRAAFEEDLRGNYRAMEAFGIRPGEAPYFLPPYEWYNRTISEWTEGLGLQLVNFTGGTTSNADYTTPSMKNYVPSDTIVSRILSYERRSTNGLNGFLLLSHIGTAPERTDKLYDRLGEIIQELKRRGYSFRRL